MSTRQKAVEQSTRPPLPWYSDPADPGEKRRADGVFDKYLTGKKLFPRELLENIKTILDNHKKGNLGNSAPTQVAQEDYVDGSNRPITLNLGPHGNTLTRLDYVPVHRLMNPHWYEPMNQINTSNGEPLNPLQVVSQKYDTTEGKELSKEVFDEWLLKTKLNWQDENTWGTMEQTFATISNQDLSRIKKIIAFEIGSMWRTYVSGESFEIRYETFGDQVWEHNLIKDIGDYLRQRTGNEVKLYVQDPTYTEEDMGFLQDLGIEPLDEPTGFTEIDEHTLVYNVKAPIPVMQITADMGEQPAMILWRSFVEHGKSSRPDYYHDDYLALKSDQISPRVEWLLQNYRHYGFGDIGGYLFRDHTRLYVRK
ncbi:hypothetical protein DPV78_007048 [Talaromyces pinophilus]|nr:hypothetical protein DPV78_007048 [Talaromyces pinophilus]